MAARAEQRLSRLAIRDILDLRAADHPGAGVTDARTRDLVPGQMQHDRGGLPTSEQRRVLIERGQQRRPRWRTGAAADRIDHGIRGDVTMASAARTVGQDNDESVGYWNDGRAILTGCAARCDCDRMIKEGFHVPDLSNSRSDFEPSRPLRIAPSADAHSMISALSSAMSGMANAISRFDRASARIAQPEPEDLIGDSVDQLTAKHDLAANAATVRTADEMLGTVIDIFA